MMDESRYKTARSTIRTNTSCGTVGKQRKPQSRGANRPWVIASNTRTGDPNTPKKNPAISLKSRKSSCGGINVKTNNTPMIPISNKKILTTCLVGLSIGTTQWSGGSAPALANVLIQFFLNVDPACLPAVARGQTRR